MARAQKEPLRPLSVAERRVLEDVVKASSERVDRVRRARALLSVAETGSFAAAARAAGLGSATTVADLVRRVNPRGGGPPRVFSRRGGRATHDLAPRAPIVG